LESLADITSETCTFHVLDGQYAVLAAGAESQAHALRLSALVGERTPLTRGCAGMVILAQLDLAGRESIFRRMAQANATVASDIRTFDESLRESGRSGYAFSFGENHAGVAGMAAPVFRGAHGEVLASIAVSGPDGRWTQTAMESALPELLSTCKELSTALAVDLDYEDAPATTATERISS
jgi:DNA-binding IclR family transcriptional regulator